MLGLVGVPLSTGAVTIAATVTPTSCGVSYSTPPCNTTQIYRLTAIGTYTAVSSATARSAEAIVKWGANLGGITLPVALSTAQTTNFRLEFFVVGASSSTAYLTGSIFTSLNSTTGVFSQINIAPVTSSTTGATTNIFLEFAMTVVVTGDIWTIQQAIIERLQ